MNQEQLKDRAHEIYLKPSAAKVPESKGDQFDIVDQLLLEMRDAPQMVDPAFQYATRLEDGPRLRLFSGAMQKQQGFTEEVTLEVSIHPMYPEIQQALRG